MNRSGANQLCCIAYIKLALLLLLLLLLIPSQLIKAGKSREVGEFELNKRIETRAIKSPGQSNYSFSERAD